MDCFMCNEAINDDYKALLSCCNTYVHTNCLIPFAESHYHHGNVNILCECGEIIYKFKSNYIDTTFETDNEINDKMKERMNDAAFKTATKTVRSKIANYNKAEKAVAKHLQEKSKAFREAIGPFVATIRTVKTDTLTELKNSDECKNFKSATTQMKRALATFSTKFNTTSRETAIHFNVSRRGYWLYRRYRSLPYIIRRKFRVML